MTHRYLKPLGTIILLLISGCATEKPQSSKPSLAAGIKAHNVIFINISSIRADHVKCFGYEPNTTPVFDSFAKDHLLFTSAYSTGSWQMPAVGSLLTSLYPSEHGATDISKTLDQKAVTLAEVLKDTGFCTAGFTCNPRLTSNYGFSHGFDFYDDYSAQMILSSMTSDGNEEFDINKQRTNDLINDAAIRWLSNNTQKPYFLFVHYYDPHWDYLPCSPYDQLYDPNYNGRIDGKEISKEPLYSNLPSETDIEHIIALYDGELRQTDNDLGELLTFLKKQGRFEDSIIIIMGDHGEAFYEHGHTSHHGIYDELIHVPLAMSLPDCNTPQKIDSLVSSVDIMPTILDQLNITVPAVCKGKSLKPVIEGKVQSIRDSIFVEYTGGAVPDCYAVRFDKAKFINEKGSIFAYDLQGDPFEQKQIFQKDFDEKMNTLFESAAIFLTQGITDSHAVYER